MTLQEILDDPQAKARFITAASQVVRDEVAAKSGLSGMAIKGGFKAIQRIRPDVVEGALEMLLPHFAPALEPYVARAQASGDVASYFAGHASEIAEAMLQVTDARAAHAKNAVMKKTYAALRSQAHQHTTEAMPRVGGLLAGFVG